MKKIILLGPPGAGKGTQADLICNYLKIPKISTGDMLREAISSGSSLGKKVSDVMNSGALVSDDIIIELILERISNKDCKDGFLFDGVPRTIGQANLCAENNITFTTVIEIDVADEITPEIGTQDPVRAYMKEMGCVDLLTRKGEIEIAMRIEEGVIASISALSQYHIIIKQLIDDIISFKRAE